MVKKVFSQIDKVFKIMSQWQDHGLIVATQKHGESGLILTVLTKDHGLHSGFVRGGASRKMQPTLQLGNLVQLDWHARLEDHLGNFYVELEESYSANALNSAVKLSQLNALCAMIHQCLPDRLPIEGFFGASLILLTMLDETRLWPELYQQWELGLLKSLGFPLDFSSCAATGQTGDLIYISPKSGRAVSRKAGEPYKDKLFPLPAHLLINEVKPKKKDILQALTISGYFIEKHILAPTHKRLPVARMRFIDRLT